MAIAANLISGLGKVAGNAAFQSGAQKLVSDVYGRLMKERQTVQADDGNSGYDMLPTKEEIAASFAVLQAELDRRHRFLTMLVIVVLAVQLLIVAVLLVR